MDWHFVRIDDKQNKMDLFPKICRGHQRALSPQSGLTENGGHEFDGPTVLASN